MNHLCQHRDSCRLCGSKELTLVVELEPTPPANAFVTKENLKKIQLVFPLNVYFCEKCYHVQLLDVLDPHELFENYVYVSGTSSVFVKHFEEYSNFVVDNYLQDKSALIIDIGSNDGTLLQFFKKNGYRVLGIDPAKDIAIESTKRGIETLPTFFNKEISEMVRQKFGQAAVITANNVFAHTDDLNGFTQGVYNLLTDDGVFVFEVSYLLDVIQKTLFDMTYHEHLSYHSVLPLISFFDSNFMDLIDVVRINTHGGSFRGVVQKKNGVRKVNSSVKKILKMEKEMKLDKVETYQKFGENINILKTKFQTLIKKLKSENNSIAGFGAPAKATTLMYHFGIGPETIDFIVDDSPLKQGLYSPGKHIPIMTPETIYHKKPNYLIILAWNFAESIMKKHAKYRNEIGHFIIPLPTLEVI